MPRKATIQSVAKTGDNHPVKDYDYNVNQNANTKTLAAFALAA